MTLQQRLVEIARREVGVREEGRNTGARVIEYQRATWLQPGPWPWCAAFTAWVLQQWLRDGDVQVALGLTTPAAITQWRCRDARAFGWEDWARRRGLQVLGEDAACKPGDFVVFDFSHIGIVSIGGKPGETLETIEGNTNRAGSREGDGVYSKTRRHSAEIIRSFVRVA